MGTARLLRSGWIAPVAVGLVGVALSFLAFWSAYRADQERVRTMLELRADWRTRDLEAKIRISGNAVENVTIAMATATAPAPTISERSPPAPIVALIM